MDEGRLLVVHSADSFHIPPIAEYVNSFARHSALAVDYVHGAHGAVWDFDLAVYDAVFVNFCCILGQPDRIGAHVRQRLAGCSGVKILAVQDEADNTELVRRRIVELGFDVVLTCVAPAHIPSIYPPERFPGVEFVSVLPGYAPEIDRPERFIRPLAERPITVGYRGRDIGFGDLGYWKLEVGRKTRAACERRKIVCDIDWTEDSRIYGEDWY